MNEITTAKFGGPGAKVVERIAFHRTELSPILDIYGRMVAAGEWRDYSMDFLPDCAVFSVFRRATEHPLYRIEKHPALAAKQGMYLVRGPAGQVLKRGHDLRQVLKIFNARSLKLVD